MSTKFFSKQRLTADPAPGDTAAEASPSAEADRTVRPDEPLRPEAADPTDQTGQTEQSDQSQPAGKMAELAGMLNNHKGKLAVGAAAMLGVAIFYKWRESRLAKEDPEEYARLQRLKKAIGSDEAPAAQASADDAPEAGKPG